MIRSVSRAIRKAASYGSLSHQLHLAERVALQLVVSNLEAGLILTEALHLGEAGL